MIIFLLILLTIYSVGLAVAIAVTVKQIKQSPQTLLSYTFCNWASLLLKAIFYDAFIYIILVASILTLVIVYSIGSLKSKVKKNIPKI